MSTSLIPLIAFGVPGIIFLILALGYVSYRSMVLIPVKTEPFIIEWSRERGDLDDSDLALPWERHSVPSPQGYDIAVHVLPGTGNRVALLQHGITWSWLGMMRHARLFHDEGWTVVTLDSRGHGDTRGGRPSYGWFERHDIKAVADWALGRFPHEAGYLALGISMGAASVLQYAPLDARLDAVIADCSYRSAVSELDHRLKRTMMPGFARPAVIAVANALCRRNAGFSLSDASPERSMLETPVPMLFIHGLADDYVPWKMSVIMAETRSRRLPDSLTELKLVPEARHARALATDPEGYRASVGGFLEKALAARATSPSQGGGRA
ncbi:MAG TPA: alpha/beta fold hydrolase [Rectinemataceae bacterium]|nr:alpha/beta fold hydrolase [Rectinemataceae bacterium]